MKHHEAELFTQFEKLRQAAQQHYDKRVVQELEEFEAAYDQFQAMRDHAAALAHEGDLEGARIVIEHDGIEPFDKADDALTSVVRQSDRNLWAAPGSNLKITGSRSVTVRVH